MGVVLPDEILSHLKIREGDTIRVVPASEGSLTLTVSDSQFQRQMEVAKDISERYRNTLRELAK